MATKIKHPRSTTHATAEEHLLHQAYHLDAALNGKVSKAAGHIKAAQYHQHRALLLCRSGRAKK